MSQLATAALATTLPRRHDRHNRGCCATTVPTRTTATTAAIRLRYPQATLALIWGRSQSAISRYLDEWMGKWGEAGEDLSILDINADFLEATCPEKYKAQGLTNVALLPDGKDFMTEVPRAHTMVTRSSWSDKVHHSAVRCISWSTPSGLSVEHTDLFLARCTEKRLVELWGPRLKKCPAGWVMLSDRGFQNTAHLYPNFNAQLTPSFLAGRLQFDKEEVSKDYEICKLRYTCEVDFSRVVEEAGLRDVIPYHFFRYLDAMNHWGHANVNLGAPLCK